MSGQRRLRLHIQGAVQGVGFRPFVYRLATDLDLRGWVLNDAQGVFLEVEGPTSRLETFLARLETERPPRAQVHTVHPTWLEPVGYPDFQIRHSQAGGDKTVLVLPDIATCDACLAEVLDPGDRRHRYPFTNCTNCGPRFTIVRELPYDRPNTTMRAFPMCPRCRAEYQDPLDRRFHAQPNACPECGPALALYGPGDPLTALEDGGPFPAVHGGHVLWALGHQALVQTAQALRDGHIVAIKGLGGFHLMVDARNAQAVARLRARKPRRDKPFALMVRDLEQAQTLCRVRPSEARALTGPEAPILLLPRRPDAPVAENVAPGNPYLGVMLPYTPLHHLLLRMLDFPLVATSGNLSDEPICTDEWEALERLGSIADRFLVHNRPIARHVDDSVAWEVDGQVRLLRRARGHAPLPVRLGHRVPTILAVGAHLKNTVALAMGNQVFISQHIGDLDTAEALAAFEQVIADFLRLYEATPVAIAHDMHPDYGSTRWARQAVAGRPGDRTPDLVPQLRPSIPLIPVQHHHAHLAGCLAEHQVEGPALGVTWDGTGYGPDGTIWGGEFLLGDARTFQRVATLHPFRLPGGDAAVKEPRRVALALLWTLLGPEALEQEDLPPVRSLRPTERHILARMLARGIHAPETTSMGRLFDGIAGLLGLHLQVSFEGQAAMALEFVADVAVQDAYPLPVRASSPVPAAMPMGAEAGMGSPGTSPGVAWQAPEAQASGATAILDWRPLVQAVLEDVRRGVEPGTVAARFHNALVEAILEVAQMVGVSRVALTGGCFQNRLLTERAVQRLRAQGFQVLLHRQVPPNDGGISLGQVAVAAARLEADQVSGG